MSAPAMKIPDLALTNMTARGFCFVKPSRILSRRPIDSGPRTLTFASGSSKTTHAIPSASNSIRGDSIAASLVIPIWRKLYTKQLRPAIQCRDQGNQRKRMLRQVTKWLLQRDPPATAYGWAQTRKNSCGIWLDPQLKFVSPPMPGTLLKIVTHGPDTRSVVD